MIDKIKAQIKNWPRHVGGEDIEITNMIADIVSVEISRAKRNIAEQLLAGDSAATQQGSVLSAIPVSSQVGRGGDGPCAALWTKRVKASDVADMSPDVFVSSLIDMARASVDLKKVASEYSGLLFLMLDRARAQTYNAVPLSERRYGR